MSVYLLSLRDTDLAVKTSSLFSLSNQKDDLLRNAWIGQWTEKYHKRDNLLVSIHHIFPYAPSKLLAGILCEHRDRVKRCEWTSKCITDLLQYETLMPASRHLEQSLVPGLLQTAHGGWSAIEFATDIWRSDKNVLCVTVFAAANVAHMVQSPIYAITGLQNQWCTC